jgi:hypothetical protein
MLVALRALHYFFRPLEFIARTWRTAVVLDEWPPPSLGFPPGVLAIAPDGSTTLHFLPIFLVDTGIIKKPITA